mmetsp:Transcript_17675/g.32537  ORF Transcript_17675/g.32537 Transcript_17675/m.32537 type:complete len:107 (+) Transcript_17675:247-567(+)
MRLAAVQNGVNTHAFEEYITTKATVLGFKLCCWQICDTIGTMSAAVAVLDIKFDRPEVMNPTEISTPIDDPGVAFRPTCTTKFAKAFASPLAFIASPRPMPPAISK